VKIVEDTATVIVPNDQLSLAIGREGQNVRLAWKLTGYKIDIVPADPEAIEKSVSKRNEEKPLDEQKEEDKKTEEEEGGKEE